jgi:predicted transport protein
VLRDRPEALRALYDALEKHVKTLGQVEVVAKDRYVLFRSRRIFTDLSIRKAAIRVAIHTGRKLDDPRFIKIVSDGRQVTHVVEISEPRELKALEPYLKEAYAFSLR